MVDDSSFFELHPDWARSMVTGLARIEGRPVGIVANNPKFRGGMLDADSVAKTTKLVKLVEGFGLPLIFLQDMPGVMIGLEAERTGVAPKLIVESYGRTRRYLIC